jgi:MerR family redox-sensitive transcriptional activator SoxR
MTIGEVAAHAGLRASAVRYYEQMGLLLPPARVAGRRTYGPDVTHQLVVIRFAKANGFTLPEIRMLLRGFPANMPASTRWRKLASRKIVELQAAIARATAMKTMLERLMGCRCKTLERCAKGLAETLSQQA